MTTGDRFQLTMPWVLFCSESIGDPNLRSDLFFQLFSDVNEFKVDKNRLNQPVSKEAATIARGSFGMVFRRILNTQVCMQVQ